MEGHHIGNHTANHPDFDATSLAAFEQDLLA
jgi:peptidoglycan/xylan/chitin deacetylase (PgdA/CDA1 family)